MSRSRSTPPPPAGAFEPGWGEPHDLTSLEGLIPVRLARLTELFTRMATLCFTDTLGVRVTDLRILNVLHEDDAVSIAEISRRARVDKAWISRLVRDLEEKGLVTRRPDPADARAMLLSLTDEGRALQKKVLPITLMQEQKALGGIDRDAFIATLDLFERNSLALLMSLERNPPALD